MPDDIKPPARGINMLEIMKKGYAAILMIALLAASVLAEDMLNSQYVAVLWSALSDTNVVTVKIIAADGSACGSFKICKTTPVGINFVNGNQRCRVEYRTIPPQVAEKCGYDPAKAAEFENLLKRRESETIYSSR